MNWWSRCAPTLLTAALLTVAALAQSLAPVVVTRTPGDATQATQPGVVNRMSVAIDAAHGGADSGARIGEGGSSSLLEKDITLALALKLQKLLTARGFSVAMTRTGDAADKPNATGTPMTQDDRAGIANHARGSACLLLHAAGSGHGVHLYTSELDGVSVEMPLLAWSTAQAAWIASSAQLEKHLAESLRQSGVSRIVSRASVQPVDSLTCPAVIVELAPEGENVKSVGDDAYQERVAESIAAALEMWSKQAQPPPRLPPPAPKPKLAPVIVKPQSTTPETQP